MGSFPPGFGVLLLPMLVLACLPRRADWPFVAGAKEAFWPRETARGRTAPAALQLRRMRRLRGIMAGLAVASLEGGAVLCFVSLCPGEQTPGSKLPGLSLSEAVSPGANLPAFARLLGAVTRPDEAWMHDCTIRTTRYHDVYIPFVTPSWGLWMAARIRAYPARTLSRGGRSGPW